jgi:hypothetical protein
MKPWSVAVLVITFAVSAAGQRARPGAIAVSGELRQWHKVTLTLDGPETSETADPNPFLDHRLTVTFVHESGAPSYSVPGYFAADGNAANSGASAGNKWRVHFSPDKVGRWDWRVAFVSGRGVAVDAAAVAASTPVSGLDGATGRVRILATNKTGVDFRSKGRLEYVGARYLRFAGTGDYFLKVGTDSPETLLGYADFDGTRAMRPAVPLKTYAPHVGDWRTGDPSWQNGKGKGLIGAINYLSSKGVNSMSFLPYNAGGDGDNVWPFVSRDDKFHYDVSKLDQWQIVFDHAQAKGLYLHVKLQEQENDDNNRGTAGGGGRAGGAPTTGPVVESLDGGDLGRERKLYVRELVARFGYALALNWNLGEENTQTSAQQRDMAGFITAIDPYDHLVVVHTFPNTSQDLVYPSLLGDLSTLTGASLQSGWNLTHERTLKWIQASEQAGKAWVVANDEQAPANLGVPPDPGFKGYKGQDNQGNPVPYGIDDVRKMTLWGTLMAGGAGVEYYFGYQLVDNDLVAEDFRSRDRSWEYGRQAIQFFTTPANRIPFWEMRNANALVGNPQNQNTRYALAKPGELYLVYVPTGGAGDIDLSAVAGTFSVSWFDPRNGGAVKRGSPATIKGGGSVSIGAPPDNPTQDWLAIVRKN